MHTAASDGRSDALGLNLLSLGRRKVGGREAAFESYYGAGATRSTYTSEVNAAENQNTMRNVREEEVEIES